MKPYKKKVLIIEGDIIAAMMFYRMGENKNDFKKIRKWNVDCDGTRTHNRLAHKRTLNHLAKLAKWLNCVVSTYMYGTFDCMFLSCQVRVSEWIHTL